MKNEDVPSIATAKHAYMHSGYVSKFRENIILSSTYYFQQLWGRIKIHPLDHMESGSIYLSENELDPSQINNINDLMEERVILVNAERECVAGPQPLPNGVIPGFRTPQSTYQYPIALNDSCAFSEEKIDQQIKELSSITQEFIESFGFVREYNHTGDIEGVAYYKKIMAEGVYVYLSSFENHTLFSLRSDKKPSDGITFLEFQNFTCMTQAELQFLLTKGRIDCSK